MGGVCHKEESISHLLEREKQQKYRTYRSQSSLTPVQKNIITIKMYSQTQEYFNENLILILHLIRLYIKLEFFRNEELVLRLTRNNFDRLYGT